MNTRLSPYIKNFYADTNFRLRDVRKIKALIIQLFKQEKKPLKGITCVFCSDDYLLEINKSHLNHDFYTDIITFDLSEDENTVGELYISVDRVKENARNYNHTLRDELNRVIIHGVLHLCGYGDKTASEQKQMRFKEEFYLKVLERST